MDSTLAAGYISAGSAIIGVVLGSFITGFGNWREKSRKRKNVRRVLSWENAYNIANLEAFWEKVNQEDRSKKLSNEIKEFERNLHFSEENLDDWGHQMWQNYSGEVASVLSNEEFNQSYRLHNTLDKFSSQRKSLAGIIYGDMGKNAMIAYNKPGLVNYCWTKCLRRSKRNA